VEHLYLNLEQVFALPLKRNILVGVAVEAYPLFPVEGALQLTAASASRSGVPPSSPQSLPCQNLCLGGFMSTSVPLACQESGCSPTLTQTSVSSRKCNYFSSQERTESKPSAPCAVARHLLFLCPPGYALARLLTQTSSGKKKKQECECQQAHNRFCLQWTGHLLSRCSPRSAVVEGPTERSAPRKRQRGATGVPRQATPPGEGGGPAGAPGGEAEGARGNVMTDLRRERAQAGVSAGEGNLQSLIFCFLVFGLP
jgi:hypothetical protein